MGFYCVVIVGLTVDESAFDFIAERMSGDIKINILVLGIAEDREP
jgi:hypothetical protein